MPLRYVAFVTAFDDYAVEVFELNVIDYLLKPVQNPRLMATLDRARERLNTPEPVEQRSASLNAAATAYQQAARCQYLKRIPVRRRDEVVILAVRQIASAIAKLDPRRFVRLGRGTLANLDAIARLLKLYRRSPAGHRAGAAGIVVCAVR